MLSNLDVDLSGKISLSEWLVYMKALADKDPSTTKKVLETYDAYLSGEMKPTSKRRQMGM